MFVRFCNNGITVPQFRQLIQCLSEETCPVANIFLDWNPIYSEEYETRLGYSNQAYEPVDDE